MRYFPILELLQDSDDPPLTPESLEALQAKLGVRFPGEYAEILLQFNGGHFHRSFKFYVHNPTWRLNTVSVALFFGTGLPIESGGLVWNAEILSDRLPPDYLAIADCNGEDLVLLKLVRPDSDFEGVWLWDGPGFWLPEEGPNIHWLADSFDEFLSMLYQDIVDCEEEECETLSTFLAVERGNLRAVERYLAQGGAVEARNDQGCTLLAAAAKYSWPKIVRLLLEHSADPNARDGQGRTPLHHAATSSFDSVKLLLAARADATARDRDGKGVLADWWYRVDLLLRAHGAEE